MAYKCDKCNSLDTHYVHTDPIGGWHFYCDEHDPRELFQENLKLKKQIKDLEVELNKIKKP